MTIEKTNRMHVELTALIDWTSEYAIVKDLKEGEILIYNNRHEYFFAGALLDLVSKFAPENNIAFFIDERGIHLY